MMKNNSLLIRPATLHDTKSIASLLREQQDKGIILARNEAEVTEKIRDFFLCFEKEELLGTVALPLFWEKMAEIRSLVVKETHQRRGIGKYLVEFALDEARRIGCSQVFTLTYQEVFFKKMGFRITDKENFSKKIWIDCAQCTKFHQCDEIGMIIDL